MYQATHNLYSAPSSDQSHHDSPEQYRYQQYDNPVPQENPAPPQALQYKQPKNSAPRYFGAFKEFASLKCHGNKAAIELKPSITRNEWETVMLEAATSTGPRKFNWSQKTSLQITKNELPHVISVLLGIKPSYEAQSHGEEKNKGFKLIWQQQQSTSLFVTVFEGGKPAMGVPVSGFDAMMLGHMALVQYVRNFPGLTTEACIKSLEIMARHNI